MTAATFLRKTAAAKRSRGGRPTKDDIVRRNARVLEVAFNLFIEKGFSATTLDEIAKTANVAKRTLYQDYQGKDELFLAVVRSRVALDDSRNVRLADDHASIEDALLQLAEDVVRICTNPGTAEVSRLLVSEAKRFPEVSDLVTSGGTRDLIHNVSEVFNDLARTGCLELHDSSEKEAWRFCDLMVGMSPLHVAAGVHWSTPDREELIARVRLFIGRR
jgi:AcrR family transcriptional regulator